jgi:sensor histidine kinase YesM
MKFTLLFLLIICSFVPESSAQNPVCRKINNQNGLPSNTVFDIAQDKQGFIWIAHDKGLSKFDGRKFLHFSAKGQQGKSLSNINFYKSQTWVQDFSGNFYRTEKDSLILEKSMKLKGEYSPSGIINGHYMVYPGSDVINCYDLELKQKNTFRRKTADKASNCIWNDKIYYFEGNEIRSFDGRQIKTEGKYDSFGRDFFYLVINANHTFAIKKNVYPLVYELSGQRLKPINKLKNGLFVQGAKMFKDEIWVSTSDGAYCFDEHFNEKYSGRCFFEGNSISNVFKDREGNYWFTTLNSGILFVPDITVNLYQYDNLSITALSKYKDENNMLVGTSNNSILNFNIINRRYTKIYNEAANHEVFDIFFDQENDQILYTSDKLIYIKNGEKVKSFTASVKSFSSINSDLIAVALGSGIGLISKTKKEPPIPQWLKREGRKFVSNHYPIDTSLERGRDVYWDDESHSLYAANAKGLYCYNDSGEKEILFGKEPLYASKITQNNGLIYIGTFSEGLFKLENGQTKSMNELQPRLTKSIYKLKSKGPYIWLVGEELIQRYNTQNNQLTDYDFTDGLPKAEIKDILVQNNKVFVATSDGLVVFDEQKQSLNKTMPNLILNSFLVNNTLVDLSKKNKFKFSENNISIHYSLLSFRGLESAIVQYRINNNHWQNINKFSNQLDLSSLAAGTYIIELRAFNEDGIATGKNIKLQFSIEAPFYKTPAYYIIVALSLLSLMYLFFRQRLGSERKSNKLKQEKNKLEQDLKQSMLSSIKSQMNPHFLFNALNTIQSYIYTNDKENASQYLGKFSELTRMILDLSNKEIVSLAEEIKSLKLYVELEQLRFEDKLKYEFVIDENLSTETSYIPSMLIQPYIENAIKHGLLHQKRPWHLLIKFTQKGNGVDVIVDDNGVGRKRSQELNKHKNRKQHESFATNANQKRLEILNKDSKNSISIKIIDKEDQYGNATGTCIYLHIPFAQKK